MFTPVQNGLWYGGRDVRMMVRISHLLWPEMACKWPRLCKCQAISMFLLGRRNLSLLSLRNTYQQRRQFTEGSEIATGEGRGRQVDE